MESNSEISSEKKPSQVHPIQDYLSIGYVFLLILGVCHETIYYKFLGVNILEYSSILDVLISPIAVLLGNLILGLVVVVVAIMGYFYLKLIPKYYNWLGTKKKYQEGKNKLKLEKAQKALKNKNASLVMIGFFVFCLFIGLGIGRGKKTKRTIDEKDIKLSHVIKFEDGEEKRIKMLGKNSLYVFYVTNGKEEVSIVPIDGNIKLIQKLKIDD